MKKHTELIGKTVKTDNASIIIVTQVFGRIFNNPNSRYHRKHTYSLLGTKEDGTFTRCDTLSIEVIK